MESLKSPLSTHRIYHNHRTQDSRSKRTFGGISLLFNKSISKGIVILPFQNASFMWFKLNKDFLSLQNDMYICMLHIPPKNSIFTLKNGNDF